MSLFFFSFLAGVSGAWGIMKFGGKIGVNDVPNARSSHSMIIPKGGGIGFLAVVIFSGLSLSLPVCFWLPASFLSLVSLWGDRHEISPGIRLLIQFACAFIFLGGGWYTGHPNVTGWLILPLAIFMVGTTNFYNFMDGIDGLAGMTGIVGFLLLWFFNRLKEGNDIYGVFCVAMAISCAGFMLFNLPRARVFMGDVGSILLGFIFAGLMISLASSPGEFLILPGVLSMFFFDEIFTMTVRIRERESLLKPHRKHIYQLLTNELSIPHWKISLAYAFLQAVIGLALIRVGPNSVWMVLGVYGCAFLLFVWGALYIRKKVYGHNHA